MAKQIITQVKLQIPGGQANPSPPVGPALGQHGVNIMEFCKSFNAKTSDRPGLVIPVISVHMGLRTTGGAAGVGLTTTRAVMFMILTILIIDAMFPPLMLQ